MDSEYLIYCSKGIIKHFVMWRRWQRQHSHSFGPNDGWVDGWMDECPGSPYKPNRMQSLYYYIQRYINMYGGCVFEMKIFHQIYRYLITQVMTMSGGRKGLSLTHPIHNMFPIRADPDILSGLMLSVTLPNGYMNAMSGGIITR